MSDTLTMGNISAAPRGSGSDDLSAEPMGFESYPPLGFDAGDGNLYRYVGNDPTDATDPSGLAEDPASMNQRRAPRLPRTNGTWTSGVPGNGVFTRSDGVQVQYLNNRPVFTPFVGDVGELTGNPEFTGQTASVELDVVTGKNFKDFPAANEAMSQRYPGWEQPKDWTWHHAGEAGSRTMELVPFDVNNGFPHSGTASDARVAASAAESLMAETLAAEAVIPEPMNSRPQGKIARGANGLAIVGILTEIAIEIKENAPVVSGENRGRGVVNAPYIFNDNDGNGDYIVVHVATRPGLFNWTWRDDYYKNYVNQSIGNVSITQEAYQALQTEAQKRFGYLKWNWLKFQYEFIPGTERQSLPVETEQEAFLRKYSA